MATVYDVLRLLAAYGWTTLCQVGEIRHMTNSQHPGVLIRLRGRLSATIRQADLAEILEKAGLEGGSR